MVKNRVKTFRNNKSINVTEGVLYNNQIAYFIKSSNFMPSMSADKSTTVAVFSRVLDQAMFEDEGIRYE